MNSFHFLLDLKTAIAHVNIHAPTRSASAFVVIISTCISTIKWMASLTMRLSSVLCCHTLASEGIDAGRYRFKMDRIDASPVSAKVISIIRIGNWANKHLKGKSLSARVNLMPESGVALLSVPTSNPYPTRGSVKTNVWMDGNFTKESSEQLSVYGKSVRIVWNHLSLLNRFDGLGATARTVVPFILA